LIETALSPSRSRDAFHPVAALKIAVVIVLAMILYADVLIGLAKDWWNEPSLSHGMLIPPLAIYIAWLQRARTRSRPVSPDLRGVAGTAVACLTFLLGRLAAEFFLTRISFVILMASLVWTFWGVARLRTLVFPFVLLATMVPLPALVYNSLSAPLQLLASDLATRLAQALGVTIFRDGNIIHLASASLGVAEACSGLASLSTLMVASLLLGYLLCWRMSARVSLLLASIPLAIAVNILRITGTAILADYNRELALGFYHSFSGWLAFMAGFGILYGIAKAIHAVVD